MATTIEVMCNCVPPVETKNLDICPFQSYTSMLLCCEPHSEICSAIREAAPIKMKIALPIASEPSEAKPATQVLSLTSGTCGCGAFGPHCASCVCVSWKSHKQESDMALSEECNLSAQCGCEVGIQSIYIS